MEKSKRKRKRKKFQKNHWNSIHQLSIQNIIRTCNVETSLGNLYAFRNDSTFEKKKKLFLLVFIAKSYTTAMSTSYCHGTWNIFCLCSEAIFVAILCECGIYRLKWIFLEKSATHSDFTLFNAHNLNLNDKKMMITRTFCSWCKKKSIISRHFFSLHSNFWGEYKKKSVFFLSCGFPGRFQLIYEHITILTIVHWEGKMWISSHGTTILSGISIRFNFACFETEVSIQKSKRKQIQMKEWTGRFRTYKKKKYGNQFRKTCCIMLFVVPSSIQEKEK